MDIRDFANSSNFSIPAKHILLELDSILSTNTSDIMTINRINTLIAQSKNLTDTTEILVCGIASSVAKNSMMYWEEREADWEELLDINTAGISQKSKINKLMGMDRKHVAGAISGVYTGAEVGVAIGGGVQGAVVLGLMGGVVSACVNSAKSMQSEKPGWGWLDYISF